MSRSNPTTHAANPATRWHEWDGSNGGLRYYDKEAKTNVDVPDGFTFMLLDQLSTIKGWHDASDSGILSNEVRDTKQEVFVVKAHKGGILAEGHWTNIRDKVCNLGGNFTANLYIAFKNEDGKLVIGSLQIKGAALNAWIEFRNANRADLYKKAVRIKGYDEGKKGKIVFRTPRFEIRDITEETDAEAKEIDRFLQDYLKEYLRKTRVEQAEPHRGAEEDINQELQQAAGQTRQNENIQPEDDSW